MSFAPATVQGGQARVVRCCGKAYLPICVKHKLLLVLNPSARVYFSKFVTQYLWKQAFSYCYYFSVAIRFN